jgi:hypothetical protein
MRTTRSRVESLPLPEQYALYTTHQRNIVTTKMDRPPGLSHIAQQRLWNNWRAELTDWINSLPLR